MQIIELLTNKKYALGIGTVLAFTIFSLINVLQDSLYIVFSMPLYLSIHNILEFFIIVVSFSVFMTAWYGIQQVENKQNTTIIICLTFLAAVIFELAHTLSYNGMPNFLTPNSVNKASTYWIFSVLITSGGMFLASCTVLSNSKCLNPSLLLILTLSASLLITITIAYYPNFLPPMFIDGHGQTPFKIFLNHIAIILSICTLFSFNRHRQQETDFIGLLQISLFFLIFSGIAFTLYSHAYDIFNLLGHILQITAYYFILQALFVSSLKKPYLELFKAKERIQKLSDKNSFLFQQALRQRQEVEESFSLLGEAISSRLDLNHTLSLIVNLSSNMLKAKYALLATLESQENRLNVVAARGFMPPPSFIPMEESLAGKACRQKLPFCIQNSENQSSFFYPSGLSGKIFSIVAAPIIQQNRVIGVLELYSEERNAFSFRESQLLSTFARHAGVALENSFLFEETRRHLQEQQILYKLVTNLSSPLQLEEILEQCLIDIVQALKANRGSVFLLDSENKEPLLTEVAITDLTSSEQSAKIKENIRLEKDSLLSSIVYKNQPSFFSTVEEKLAEVLSNSRWIHYPTLLIAPVSIKEKLLGVLFIGWGSRKQDLPNHQLTLATTISQQLALGIEKNMLYQKIEKMALTDPLTGLANRRHFDFYLENELASANRLQKPLCLVMLDLDKFKHYNDTYGHPTGDKVLIKIGQILRHSIDSTDLPARYGGEEFAVILLGVDLEQGLKIAEYIRATIAENYFPDSQGNNTVKLTASLGIACYNPQTEEKIANKDELIQQADSALYQAKESGRNKVCSYYLEKELLF